MIQDRVFPKGILHLRLLDEDGFQKYEVITCNMVVNAGLAHITDQLSETPGEAQMSHVAVGDGSAAPAAGQTALQGSELGRVAYDSATDAAAVLTYVATFPAGTGTGAIVEAGIFNAGAAGTMLARSTFSVINKGASDTLEITWTLTFADA